ncbi:hypothetical protein U1Q18_004328 [Sarracenia purpurea var. burkii]
MRIYDVRINCVMVKVRVVDQVDVIDLGLAELRSQIRTPPVVGVGLKYDAKNSNPVMLQFFAGSRCLMIQTHRLTFLPKWLVDFLADKGICFVGFGMQQGLRKLAQINSSALLGVLNSSNLVVEVAELAAIVLKKPELLSVGLDALAAEIDVSLGSTSAVPADAGARAFSNEEIKDFGNGIIFSWKPEGVPNYVPYPPPLARYEDVVISPKLDLHELYLKNLHATMGTKFIGRSVDVDFSNGMSHLLLQLSKRFAFRCSSSVHELRFCAGAGLATFCDLLFGFSGLEADPTLLITFFDVSNSSKFLLYCCVPFSTASIVCVFWWMPAVFASIIRKLISFWVLGMIIHW